MPILKLTILEHMDDLWLIEYDFANGINVQ